VNPSNNSLINAVPFSSLNVNIENANNYNNNTNNINHNNIVNQNSQNIIQVSNHTNCNSVQNNTNSTNANIIANNNGIVTSTNNSTSNSNSNCNHNNNSSNNNNSCADAPNAVVNQFFSVGDKVKIVLDIEKFKQMQEGHGGWNQKMCDVSAANYLTANRDFAFFFVENLFHIKT
jgi:hypothetical protein